MPGNPESFSQEALGPERVESPELDTKPKAELESPETKEPLPQKEWQTQVERLFNNAQATVKDLARIGRELFEEQAARLGYKSDRINALAKETQLNELLAQAQQQESLEVARIMNQWSEKMQDPAYIEKLQREDVAWQEQLDAGLKWADPKELSSEQKERVVDLAVGRLLQSEDSRVLFHATSKDRLAASQEITLNKNLSLQAVKPFERYFSSSEGAKADQPYVIRVLSKNRDVTQQRTDQFGEYGIAPGETLVQLPVPPEKRTSAQGFEYEIYTYAPKSELGGNESELLKQIEPQQDYLKDITAREHDIIESKNKPSRAS